MNRRDFLLLRADRDRRTMALSCERLYMRYVDAELDGSTGPFFAAIDRELRDVDVVRLTDTAWLARHDIKERLERVLDAFRARGGRVLSDVTQGFTACENWLRACPRSPRSW